MTPPDAPDAPRDLLAMLEEIASEDAEENGEELWHCAAWGDFHRKDLRVLCQRVRTAEAETARLREALLNLKRGECWCEVGIGNPMVRGVHSNACQKALDVLGASRPGEPKGEKS